MWTFIVTYSLFHTSKTVFFLSFFCVCRCHGEASFCVSSKFSVESGWNTKWQENETPPPIMVQHPASSPASKIMRIKRKKEQNEGWKMNNECFVITAEFVSFLLESVKTTNTQAAVPSLDPPEQTSSTRRHFQDRRSLCFFCRTTTKSPSPGTRLTVLLQHLHTDRITSTLIPLRTLSR